MAAVDQTGWCNLDLLYEEANSQFSNTESDMVLHQEQEGLDQLSHNKIRCDLRYTRHTTCYMSSKPFQVKLAENYVALVLSQRSTN